ncbi:CIC11C00000005238 [Sungouiella intermedia]|uniref:CIC11C00000005238 n=1 Tax=Sungouiella intermedia TaxID=45354 RepID=A0A1L0BLU0_9ASCO|nr:CIC11C00000005238 [[Candida] intermedia]
MLRSRLLRRLSTSHFDLAAWKLKLTPTKPSAIRNLLTDYSKLYPYDKLRVLSLSSESVRQSLELLTMLQEKHSGEDIFYHISNNVNSKLFSNLVEDFLLQLMAEGNLNAVVALVHIVYECDNAHYKLSNQFWSILSSEASMRGHHAAASLVYHEIVNPYAAYSNRSVFIQENHLVPFLLLPTAIALLATVFSQSGNLAAVEGLRSYFKRYYSYFGHRKVYETLTISRVEALARTGDLTKTLDAFIDLCLKYRGHTKYRDPKDSARSLKYLSRMGYKERQRNIINNIGLGNYKLDKLQLNEVRTQNITPFQPHIEYNVYHKSGKPHWTILDGVPRVSDLPCFHELVRDHTQRLISEKHSVVDRLLTLITRHHHALHKFVAVSLCELGHVEVAWAVISKLPELYPLLPKKVLYSGPEVFTCIFRSLKRAYEGKASSSEQTSKDLDYILALIYVEWQKLHGFTNAGRRSYLEALLASPAVSKQDVESVLGDWKQNGLKRISLDSSSCDRLRALDIDDTYITPCSIRL